MGMVKFKYTYAKYTLLLNPFLLLFTVQTT